PSAARGRGTPTHPGAGTETRLLSHVAPGERPPKSRRLFAVPRRGGFMTNHLGTYFREALGINLPTVEGLLERDRQDRLRGWEQWVSQPVPMRLIVRYAPAVYGTVALPGGVTTPEEAEPF